MPQQTTTLSDEKLDKLISRHERLLVDRPNDQRLADNLLKLIDLQVPRASGDGAYSKCQRALSAQFDGVGVTKKHLDVDILSQSINEFRTIINRFKIDKRVPISQIKEGNKHKINKKPALCNQYINLFEKTGAICGICYDCYKIQILPTRVIELIQLSIILKIINLDRDNARKTMIELRADVKNPYKGYIFCQSEEEAIHCLKTLEIELKRVGLGHISCGISHGCSEYGLKYPEFKFSPDGTHRTQKQPDEWRNIEEEFVSEPIQGNQEILNFSTHEITLRDVICYETWIKYSEIIKDDSHRHFLPVPMEGKTNGFIKRIEKQADIRKTQLIELEERQLG